MENFRTLLFLDRFKFFFEKIGVDYPVMRKILQVKLLMDRRKVPTIFNQSQNKPGKERNQFFRSLWIFAFFGLCIIPFLVMGENYIFQMSIVYSIVMFIIMTSMISDFSSVLLDLRDKNILSTKPITSRTINAAKIVHISIYLFFLTTSLTAIPAVVALIKQGFVFFILFIAGILLLNLFILVFTALLYFAILKFFDGERLKDIINYVQILLAIFIIVGYQLVFRSFDFIDTINNLELTNQWWQLLVPPIWFSAPFELVFHGNRDLFIMIFTILALVVPIVFLWLYIKLMPAFERNLIKLNRQKARNKKVHKNKNKWFIQLICRSKEEKCFYRFAHTMMKNEREFKLKVYPSLGFSIIFPFIMFFNELRSRTLEELVASNWFLAIYFTFMMIPTIIMMLGFSGKYKGAWIYKTTPIQDQAAIYKGTLKAFLIKLYLPIFFIVGVIFTLIFKVQIIPHLFIALLSSFVYTIICFVFLKKPLPFSQSIKMTEQQKKSGKLLLLFLLTGIFFGLHFVSTKVSYGIYAYMIVLLIVNYFLWRSRKIFIPTNSPI